MLGDNLVDLVVRYSQLQVDSQVWVVEDTMVLLNHLDVLRVLGRGVVARQPVSLSRRVVARQPLSLSRRVVARHPLPLGRGVVARQPLFTAL